MKVCAVLAAAASAASAMSTTTKPTVRFTGGGVDVSAPIEAVAMGRKRPTLMDLADEAGVYIPRSCCAGTCAVLCGNQAVRPS